LDENNANYEIVYKDAVNLTEEEIWRQAVHIASQDEQRNKEIAAWDKIASKVKDG
jgi:hypothetical protein